jgi:hypothetical protein
MFLARGAVRAHSVRRFAFTGTIQGALPWVFINGFIHADARRSVIRKYI